ncbi:hypothetical protein VNO78_09568 [Psophocarpus tetragonolobus]|uniref:Uncharacterized protein n=1 Tax=Psophocarpus tetragonolobus TaxID=3891 RepID=A0AAN9SW83_PSOTE
MECGHVRQVGNCFTALGCGMWTNWGNDISVKHDFGLQYVGWMHKQVNLAMTMHKDYAHVRQLKIGHFDKWTVALNKFRRGNVSHAGAHMVGLASLSVHDTNMVNLEEDMVLGNLVTSGQGTEVVVCRSRDQLMSFEKRDNSQFMQSCQPSQNEREPLSREDA